MKYPHTINPDDYLDKTQQILSMMLEPEYSGNNISDVNTAFLGLYNRHNKLAVRSPLRAKDPRCVEIMRAVHSMSSLWADLWLARGPEVFNERLNLYFRKAQDAEASAHDELLYQALLAKAPDPDAIDRDFGRRTMQSRLRSQRPKP